MRISTLVLAVALALGIAVPASSQNIRGPDRAPSPFDTDSTRQPQGYWDFSRGIHVGDCNNPNPRIAIPACSRELSARGMRPAERPWIYALRARAYTRRGDLDEALEDYDRAIRGASTEDIPRFLAMRAGDLALVGRAAEGLASYNDAIELYPDSGSLLNDRAWLLATSPDDNIRDGAMAVTDALKAIELSGSPEPYQVDTLAAAYAESGDFGKAAEEQEKAIEMLQVTARDTIVDYQTRLELYRQGMPYRTETIEGDP